MKQQFKLILSLFFALVLFFAYNFNIAQNVGIGAESFTPDSSAMLEVKSTEKGFLPPRMTTQQRDAIQSPAEGLVIYNTTTNCLNYRVVEVWFEVCGECTPQPIAPTAGTHVPGETQIVWNWNVASGADGYKWSLINNYATATDLGNVTTVTQTGLTCNSPYTIYVWAYNGCGNSTTETLTQTTAACPICDVPSVTFTYQGQQVTYGTVQSSGRCWLDRNLGAAQVATSTTDELAYGDLFQWGRNDDGHQTRTSITTTNSSDSDQPSHGYYILRDSSPLDWRSSGDWHQRWNAIPIVNNPCPSGYRVPTEAEWDAERLSWTQPDGAINSPLKLPIAGRRHFSDGGSIDLTLGRYWSSTVVGNIGSQSTIFLGVSWAGSHMESTIARAFGLSVRCIKD